MENLEQCREEINRIDRSMAQLFEERMKVAAQIAAYKKEHTLPILDSAREQAVLEKNVALISESELKPYYADFQKKVMRISRSYRACLMSGMMIGYSGTGKYKKPYHYYICKKARKKQCDTKIIKKECFPRF